MSALWFNKTKKTMKCSTSELLATLRKRTDALLELAIREWQMIPPARFGALPRDGGWSAAQCLDHLNGYGDYYLPLLERAIRQARSQRRFSASYRSGWLGDYFTAMMEPGTDGTPAKKMQAFRKHIPAASVAPETALARFIEQGEKMLQLLDEAEGLQLGLRSVPLSIAPFIRLKTGDVFRFVLAHNARHAAQAVRALAAVGVPATVPTPGG